MQQRRLLTAAVFAIGVMGLAGSARADYSGTGWIVTQATAGSATKANATAQSGNNNKVTFTVNGLEFSSCGTGACGPATYSLDNKIGTFLNSFGHLTSASYSGSATAATPLNTADLGMLFEFTGTAFFTNGQSFTLTHDDGAQLYIGGALYLDQPGPTAAVTSTYTYSGPTGLQAFDFIYGECCGDPALFETNLVPAVPEPGSIMLLGTALAAVVTIIRKKRA